jgi:outer membrane protein OmpA-like peptidoglycan-associated protein
MIMRPTVIRLVLLLVLAFSSGCASRSWTLALFEKQEAEIDERFLHVDQRVTALETSVGRTAMVARSARDLADIALARTGAFDQPGRRSARSGIVREPRKARALLSIVHVRFGFNRADLDEGAEKALLAVLKELHENPFLTVDLEGTTDAIGSRDYNLQLSMRRVETVRRFLLTKGIEYPRVILASGLGPLGDDRIPDEQKRRVAVKLMQSPE